MSIAQEPHGVIVIAPDEPGIGDEESYPYIRIKITEKTELASRETGNIMGKSNKEACRIEMFVNENRKIEIHTDENHNPIALTLLEIYGIINHYYPE